MAEESTNPSPEEATDPEGFHLHVLRLCPWKAAAKEAVIYHYKHVASGFSAKITPKQAEELSEKSEVIEVVPDMAAQLH